MSVLHQDETSKYYYIHQWAQIWTWDMVRRRLWRLEEQSTNLQQLEAALRRNIISYVWWEIPQTSIRASIFMYVYERPFKHETDIHNFKEQMYAHVSPIPPHTHTHAHARVNNLPVCASGNANAGGNWIICIGKFDTLYISSKKNRIKLNFSLIHMKKVYILRWLSWHSR